MKRCFLCFTEAESVPLTVDHLVAVHGLTPERAADEVEDANQVRLLYQTWLVP